MHLKNVSARVITINTPKAGKFRIIPGDTVEVPEKDLGVAQEFLDSHMEAGDLLEVVAPKAPKVDVKTESKKSE